MSCLAMYSFAMFCIVLHHHDSFGFPPGPAAAEEMVGAGQCWLTVCDLFLFMPFYAHQGSQLLVISGYFWEQIKATIKMSECYGITQGYTMLFLFIMFILPQKDVGFTQGPNV